MKMGSSCAKKESIYIVGLSSNKRNCMAKGKAVYFRPLVVSLRQSRFRF